MERFLKIFDDIHFNNEFFSIMVFAFCATMLVRVFHEAHKSQLLDWSDIITQNGPSNKVSLGKVGQLTGLFVSTWAIIHVTMFGHLTYDLFAVYLLFIGGVESYSKYIAHRSEIERSSKDPE